MKKCRTCYNLQNCADEVSGTGAEPFIKTMGEDYYCDAWEQG